MKRFLFAILSSALVLTNVASADAAIQRMGIPAGVIRISPGGSTSVEAMCFDFTRDSPNAGSTFANVLTSGAQAIVTVGDKQYPLQTAIDRHLVKVHGSQPTVADMIHAAQDPLAQRRMTPAQLTEARQMITDWNQMTPAEHAIIEEQLAPGLARFGDHEHLVIESLVHEPVSVNFQAPTVLGTAAEPPPEGSNLLGTMSANKSAQRDIQRKVWLARTARQQANLRSVGFFSGPIDGLVGDHTISAIKSFQDANGLPLTGEIDSATEAKLTAAAQLRQDISEADTLKIGDDFVVTVQTVRQTIGVVYYAVAGDGTVIYSGNSAHELAAAIRKAANNAGAAKAVVYNQIIGTDRSEGFRQTMKQVAGEGGGDDIPIEVRTDADGIGGAFAVLDHSSSNIVNVHLDETVRDTDTGPGFDMVLSTADGMQHTVTFSSKVQRIIEAFLAALKQIVDSLRTRGFTNMNLDQVVDHAYAIAANQLGVPKQQVRKEISTQFASVVIGDLGQRARMLVALATR